MFVTVFGTIIFSIPLQPANNLDGIFVTPSSKLTSFNVEQL